MQIEISLFTGFLTIFQDFIIELHPAVLYIEDYFAELRAHYRNPGENRMRTIFLDNRSEHDDSESLRVSLDVRNIMLEYFPSNATHLIQPADSFFVAKMKQH